MTVITPEQARRQAAAVVRRELKWFRRYRPEASDAIREIEKEFKAAMRRSRGAASNHSAAA
jgi:hypothetical protein